jgi:hypothetical protein
MDACATFANTAFLNSLNKDVPARAIPSGKNVKFLKFLTSNHQRDWANYQRRCNRHFMKRFCKNVNNCFKKKWNSDIQNLSFKNEISVTLEPTNSPMDKMTLLLKSLFSFGHRYSLNVLRMTLPNFSPESLSG